MLCLDEIFSSNGVCLVGSTSRPFIRQKKAERDSSSVRLLRVPRCLMLRVFKCHLRFLRIWDSQHLNLLCLSGISLKKKIRLHCRCDFLRFGVRDDSIGSVFELNLAAPQSIMKAYTRFCRESSDWIHCLTLIADMVFIMISSMTFKNRDTGYIPIPNAVTRLKPSTTGSKLPRHVRSSEQPQEWYAGGLLTFAYSTISSPPNLDSP